MGDMYRRGHLFLAYDCPKDPLGLCQVSCPGFIENLISIIAILNVQLLKWCTKYN